MDMVTQHRAHAGEEKKERKKRQGKNCPKQKEEEEVNSI